MGPFRFFSLNKPSDWKRGMTCNVSIDSAGLALKQTEQYGIAEKISLSEWEVEGPGAIADLAPGRQDRIYLLDESAALWLYDPDNRHLEPLLREGHGIFTSSAYLAAAGDTVLAADPYADTPLIAFHAANSQAVWSYGDYRGERLYPLSATQAGGCFLVLAMADDSRIVLLRLGSSGQLLAETEIDSARVLPEGMEAPLAALQGRFQLAGTEDGTAWLLDTGTGRLLRLPDGSEPEWFGEAVRQPTPSGIALDGRGGLFIGDASGEAAGDNRHTLLLAEMSGEQCTVRPMASYHGRSDKLLTNASGQLYAWNRAEATVTVLQLLPRTNSCGNGRYEGTWISCSLDSTRSENEWHKAVLEADVEEGLQLRLSWFASDRKTVALGGRVLDLDQYISDPDIPAEQKLQTLKPLWTHTLTNPQDALLVSAKGRYLWLKLEWVGSETASPLLRRLRIYDPRMSYLSYLPAVYQEDEKSRSFLERYLSLFATFMEDMDETIAGIARYFDPDATDGPYLRWLASWLGLSPDEHWTEQQLRLWMREAPGLYRFRGTRAAISRMVEIYTGEAPMIIEHFQIRHLLENAEFRETASRLYSDDPYTFCVLVKPEHAASDKQKYVLQQLLDAQKPAFTEAKLVVLQPWMNMDMHTYLGINTTLAEPSWLKLDHRATLPYHTVLIDVERDNRMDIHTRLGLDSELE